MSELTGLLLPADTRLLHLGPHKTGTTAIQYAFHESRQAQHEQGVHYAHRGPQAYLPALGLTGRRGRRGGPVASPEDWQELLRELDEYDSHRCVISSESFSHCDPATIARLRDDLGPDRVHILRMVRRYDLLMASQWQQSVADGAVRISFDAWLRRVLGAPEHPFWYRHHYAEMTKRWADIVGPDHMTVVVVDESDRTWLRRIMEALVGLKPGTLPQPTSTNDSLTCQETVMLMWVNRIMSERGWVDKAHHQYLRTGARPGLRSVARDPEARRILLPTWARSEVRELSLRHLDQLRASGARMVGDVDALVVPEEGSQTAADDTFGASMPVLSVVAAVAAVIDRVQKPRAFPIWTGTPPPPLRAPRRGVTTPEGERFVTLLERRAEELGWDAVIRDRHIPRIRRIALGKAGPAEVVGRVPAGRMPIEHVARIVATAVETTDDPEPGTRPGLDEATLRRWLSGVRRRLISGR